MKYDTTELFAEINAYRRRSAARKIARAFGIAAGIVYIWAIVITDLDRLFFF